VRSDGYICIGETGGGAAKLPGGDGALGRGGGRRRGRFCTV
jgi:hypothetical protein